MHTLADIAAALPNVLIALDFDGTLSEIVADPMAARPVAGVVDTLTELAAAGVRIAIVTGRDARTVLELGGLAGIPGLVVSGLHGAETWRDGELDTLAEPAGLQALREELPALLPAGVWLEDKRLSLVLHTRRAANPVQALAQLEETVPALVERHGLEAHPGKLVLEIRIPGRSKATALAGLLTEDLGAALFAGDDLGDLPAVRSVAQWGRRTGRPAVTIAVGAVEQLRAECELTLADPVELAAALAGLGR